MWRNLGQVGKRIIILTAYFIFSFFLDSSLGNQESTRCLGNYLLKGSYKEYDILSSATQEPITAEPDIQSKTLDESCRFLLLMSSGLYKSIEEATGSDQVNKFIAQCVVEQVCILSDFCVNKI